MPIKDKEKKNAYMREWKKQNRSKINEKNKLYKAKNPEKWAKYAKNWEKKNREFRRLYERKVEISCEKCGRVGFGFRESQRFCSRECMGQSYKRPIEVLSNKAYILKWVPYLKKKYPEHRLVMEKKIGRKLKSYEVVHHIDENKRNNNPNNLFLFNSNSEHMKYHKKCQK